MLYLSRSASIVLFCLYVTSGLLFAPFAALADEQTSPNPSPPILPFVETKPPQAVVDKDGKVIGHLLTGQDGQHAFLASGQSIPNPMVTLSGNVVSGMVEGKMKRIGRLQSALPRPIVDENGNLLGYVQKGEDGTLSYLATGGQFANSMVVLKGNRLEGLADGETRLIGFVGQAAVTAATIEKNATEVGEKLSFDDIIKEAAPVFQLAFGKVRVEVNDTDMVHVLVEDADMPGITIPAGTIIFRGEQQADAWIGKSMTRTPECGEYWTEARIVFDEPEVQNADRMETSIRAPDPSSPKCGYIPGNLWVGPYAGTRVKVQE